MNATVVSQEGADIVRVWVEVEPGVEVNGREVKDAAVQCASAHLGKCSIDAMEGPVYVDAAGNEVGDDAMLKMAAAGRGPDETYTRFSAVKIRRAI